MFKHLFVVRQYQVQRVAADVCRTSDVMTQTAPGDHVDSLRVELTGDVPRHVEIADDDKSVAQHHGLVEPVGQLVSEGRRDGPGRPVDTTTTETLEQRPVGLTASDSNSV